MKLRALIADDESLSRDRLRRLLEKEPGVEIVAECATGRETIDAIQSKTPDVVFLDINMPDIDGFGVLKALKGDHIPVIVFVTAFDQFALQAFDANAVDYLLKPYDHERFRIAFGRARELHRGNSISKQSAQLAELLASVTEQPKGPKRLTIKTGSRLVFVNVADIEWISSAGNYSEVHVGNASHLWRGTIATLLGQLPDDQFARISRSAIVNLDRVKEIRPKSHGDAVLTLCDGKTLLVSRKYRPAIEALLKSSI